VEFYFRLIIQPGVHPYQAASEEEMDTPLKQKLDQFGAQLANVSGTVVRSFSLIGFLRNRDLSTVPLSLTRHLSHSQPLNPPHPPPPP
jgi:hypothetical protein